MRLALFIRQPKISVIIINFLLTVVIGTFYIQKGYCQGKSPAVINMVFTSDAHYGITRKNFRGDTNVTGRQVNAAMIREINSVPNLMLPADGGVGGGNKVTAVDYLIQTGDIANRMEIPIQSAAISWAQFETDYMQSVKLTGHNGQPAKLLLAPGNHDISNAIGFAKPMKPLTDPTSMVEIYNLMLKPKIPLTNATYNYAADKINYAFNLKGIHMMFITLWPDSAERIWIQKDLDTVNSKAPVIIFTHDQPTSESKHFTNPLPPYNMTALNEFQNLVAEHYKEGPVAEKGSGATDIEQRGFVRFLKAHPNIKAYFHGNSNWNEFYVYQGPDKDVKLNTFRVDSPMKGDLSSKDEKRLSFQLISMDTEKQLLTVRECLWNTKPNIKSQKPAFGESVTVSLKVDEAN
ncbi:metallophosphoesterase [Mucilaginibacter sp.]|uniref:metallophosphoesterase family protein n=1 Tax=Mucilaginibacter sp. TaxID=1882438 RepID=UPI0025F89563|nr:metallophosphoesterase [Mucilaginibacter sp.]